MTGQHPGQGPAARLRFPKSSRLVRASEFAKVRKDGQSVHGRLMTLGVLKGLEGSGSKIGLITSKRVGIAVERNRVRRRLRELVRADRSRLIEGLWLVIVAKSSASRATFQKLREEWSQLARRGAILKEAA